MSSVLHVLLLFSALWTLSSCGTRQFHVVEVNKNWTEARKYCRENFTDLATIESPEEMDAVKAVLNGATGNFWIGLSNKAPHGVNTDWIWSDGKNSSYRDWDTGEPKNPGTDNCVQYSGWNQGPPDHSGNINCDEIHENKCKWKSEKCCEKAPFICYKNISFVLVKENKTWGDALNYCRENYTDLVSVHSKKIQDWVKNVSKNASTVNVWMGLRHIPILSLWFWVSGEPICYQNWAPGNGTGVEDCSETQRTGAVQTGSGQWVSLPETQTLNFICSFF